MQAALALAVLLAVASAALTGPVSAKKQTYGCPIAGISAVCPSYTRGSVSRALEAAGVEKRHYSPAVFAYLAVNASSFGSAAVSTTSTLNAYLAGQNEAGFHFHDTQPSYLRFEPSKDGRAVGREFVASRFLDVAQAADAPAPTANSELKVCKARTTTVFVANWTSASPLPGPPTAATVLAHLSRMVAALKKDHDAPSFCSRTAWLMSYSPDSQVMGRKYFEVSVDAGRCRAEEEGGQAAADGVVAADGAVCPDEGVDEVEVEAPSVLSLGVE